MNFSKIITNFIFLIGISIIIIFSFSENYFYCYTATADITFCIIVPFMIYSNADSDKLQILNENRNKTGIYLWTHLEDNNKYVGSASNLSSRFYSYYSIPKLNKNNSYISRALLKYGYAIFRLSILEYIDISNLPKKEARKLILEREQYYLDLLEPEYNILKTAGSPLGHKQSEELKLLRSTRMSGEGNPMFGKNHTPESIALLTRSGESHHFFGKKHTEESKIKNRLSNLGQKRSIETRLKIGLASTKSVYVYTSEEFNLHISFNSCKDAAQYFNCTQRSISKYLDKDKIYKNKWMLFSKRR